MAAMLPVAACSRSAAAILRNEAFAGLHNAGRRIVDVFDEASDIPRSRETARGRAD
jgi:hypothetical protein